MFVLQLVTKLFFIVISLFLNSNLAYYYIYGIGRNIMFHRIIYIVLVISLSFSVDLVKESYNFEYNYNQKTLNIENQLEYLDLTQKLNDIYEINSESLIELGILPFSTLYLVENNKNYSVQIDVTSSYMLVNINKNNDLLIKAHIRE